MLSFNLNVMVPNNMNSIFFLGGQFAPDGGGQFNRRTHYTKQALGKQKKVNYFPMQNFEKM
jgi:hypothetical protein